MRRGLVSVLVVFRPIKGSEGTFEFMYFSGYGRVTWFSNPLDATHWSSIDTAERMTAGEEGAQVGRLNVELQWPDIGDLG